MSDRAAILRPGHPRRLIRRALDAVLPPRCLGCGTAMAGADGLCPACFGDITFLADPACAACGFPFEIDTGAPALCAACQAHRPAFDTARAVFAYSARSRDLVLDFKHRDRLEGTPGFARWLARAGHDVLARADAIVPVPLQRWRLLKRRYNQAAELARALARETGIPAAVDLLRRTRPTESQGRKSRLARRRNVRGAFAVAPQWAPRLPGARLVLVDDVFTTGATVEECARVLKRAGAAHVAVLTLARVIAPGDGRP